MVNDVQPMKVMLFDKETAGIVSMVLSQSDILERDVVLTELIESDSRERMPHLKAIVFVRPTDTNIRHLKRELLKPHYGEYNIFFSNLTKPTFLEDLAQSDEHECVRQVQEYFGDYFAITESLFTLNVPGLAPHSFREYSSADTERIVEGLASVLLALKRRPQIRFQRNSSVCENITRVLTSRMEHNRELFHQVRLKDSAPLLLILDRRDDPVTPLLSQWTYQAMVHELIGIRNHRVELKDATVPKDMREVVLAMHQDDFFRANATANFGDLGINVKNMVDEYQVKHKSQQNIQSIEDMQRFVENYPEFRKQQANVSKHVSVISELSRIVERTNLMAASEVEQHLACTDSHTEAVKKVHALLNDSSIPLQNKLRLVMLYALRYEDRSPTDMTDLIELLTAVGADQQQLQLIHDLVEYAGANKRSGDLFSNKNVFNILKKTVQRELVGVSNVYTQHKPYLDTILDQLSKGKLREQQFTSLDGSPIKERSSEVIVFFVGGATYAEAAVVDQFNKSNSGMKAVLGGTCIQNSESFLEGLKKVLGVDSLR
eukprot:c32774_g1_i1.p1 GENE.c32774_g1_i1~~c32774_g1_i1.p1  ORF type:complete len:573 (+),score=169.14 c32774_g1_i1:84-1721(+)